MSSLPIDHEAMMKRAIAWSAKAVDEPRRYCPFGAVIVDNKTGEIVAEGVNDTQEKMDPTAHGEIVAIRKACAKLNSQTLENCTLYTSFEPCGMCSAVIWVVRLPRVFYGAEGHSTADIDDKAHQFAELSKPISQREYVSKKASPELERESERIVRAWAAAAPDNMILQRYDSNGKALPVLKIDD